VDLAIKFESSFFIFAKYFGGFIAALDLQKCAGYQLQDVSYQVLFGV